MDWLLCPSRTYILSACCCTDTNFTIEMFQSCTSHLKVGYSAYGMDGVHTDDVDGAQWGMDGVRIAQLGSCKVYGHELGQERGSAVSTDAPCIRKLLDHHRLCVWRQPEVHADITG